jgi:hypothetical protein
MRFRSSHSIRACCFLAIFPALSACSWFGGSGKTDEAELTEEAADVLSEADYRGRLEEEVADAIESADVSDGNRVIRKRPYYYREYSEYPGGPNTFDIELTAKDSRTVPYIADVSVEKIRFSTRLHRDSSEAELDSHFLRDTGREIMTYEVRNGEWRRISSLFVADKTEEQVNGEWVPVQEEPERTVAAEEPASDTWLGRTWDRIQFWR